MPNPSSANVQQVNFELGVSNTSLLRLSNNWVQNVAVITDNVVSTSTFTSGSGSVTAPSDATIAIINVWGAGGGGNELRGGGGSGFSRKIISVTGGSTSISYNVGAGGAGSFGGTGGTGGTSNATVGGTVINATGGQGAPRAVNALGGSGSGGDVNEDSVGGATTISGGQAGGSVSLQYGGGTFQFGLTSAGNPYGGGGGGGSGTSSGGAGATGAVVIQFAKEQATNFGRLRWGINFPGGYQASIFDSSVNSYSKTYNTGSNLTIYAQSFGSNYAESNTILSLNSNGVLVITTDTSSAVQYKHHVTWLTSGVNTDYTANLYVSTGSFGAPGGSVVNTDLGLDATREWYVAAASSGEGSATGYANCELIIKSGGVLISRNIILWSFAESAGI